MSYKLDYEISPTQLLTNTYINKEERQQWLKRAQTDKKADFVAILSE